MTESFFVKRNGFRLNAVVTGRPRGAPWIVLSNSLAASWQMWEPQLDWLGRRYRILAYDTRGHGELDAPSAPYSLDDLVGDVIGLMDHFEIGKAAYMGLSLGGMTALGLALKHPSRFERLVCCDARADAPEAYVKSWDERIAVVDGRGLDAILPGTLERWLVPAFRAAHPQQLARITQMILKTSREGYKGCAAAIKGLDYGKDLGRVSVPMLYVGGAEDLGASPEVMRAMAAATPGAAFIEIPNGAHLPNIDNAAAFNAAVGGFLGIA